MHGWFNQCSNWFGRLPYGGPMFIIGILVLIVIGVLVYQLIRNRGHESFRGREKPEEILKSRYARGEISQKEYQEMMTDLKDN